MSAKTYDAVSLGIMWDRLVSLVDEIVSKNPDKVADAKNNPKAIGWFVGQVMKSSGGKANPQAVNDILKKKLGL